MHKIGLSLSPHEAFLKGLTKLVLQICEEGLKLTEESAHRLQQPMSTWTMLLDLGNYHPDIVIDI